MTGAEPGDLEDPSLLAAGHALGSLTPDEQAQYDAYLAASADARREADSFASAAAALEHDVPDVAPSTDLKARLMAQIAVTPQLDQTGSDAVVATTDRPTELAEPVGRAEQRAQARWFRRPGMVLAAAAAAAVLFIGGGAIGIALGNGSSNVQQQATTFAQISAAPDAQRTTQDVTGGGTVTLISSHELGRSAVVVDGLKKPPSGKAYQLWYISGKTAVSAGLLADGTGASAWQVLDGHLTGGAVVGMTVEPEGGSKAPTTTPVVTIAS